ncbi:MAG: hypothetical protein KDK44_01650 [Chlamydiia bacterium]|nr:hypothetical protein [Chlamydiia bacterium]MCP5509742.1 hypothetical protein [Chlamydiales bacterium]HPE85242.1 Npt1/Npt2 family nucleotide transporter [Chlamydiales bacterium]
MLNKIFTKDTLFVLFAMLTGFCMTAEYALTKPTTNSVFIAAYGAGFYPYVWLATLPLNLIIVSLYNRFVLKIGCMRMLALTAGFGMIFNLLGAFYLEKITWLPFVFYLWKDVYILIMLQQLWSVIHATISGERSKYLYGWIFAVGGLGSIIGSLVPTFFAVELGSARILLFNLPLYILVTILYAGVLKMTNFAPKPKEVHDKVGGLKLIANSRYLQYILFIVMFMQIASNLIEYQFNTMVQANISDQDLRTQFYGQWWGAVHTANLCLQLVGSYLMVKWMGLRKSHVVVPIVLLLNSLAFLALPTLGVMCVAFGTVKAFDYSLFAILKEMLYVPLQKEEKFKAKAIIDVFAYRSAKVLGAFTILALQMWASSAISWTALGIFTLWALMSARFAAREKLLAAQ